MDTDRTPAEMAKHLADQFPGDAAVAYAESHRQESITRQRHGAAAYWVQVVDLLASQTGDAMNEPKPRDDKPQEPTKPVLLDISRDQERHPRDETGRYVQR